MNKSLALIPVIFAIFALVVSPAVMDISAEKGGNDKARGDPQGCDNGKGKDDINNPNCGDPVPPGNTDCTYLSTGSISADDLSFAIFGDFTTTHVTIASDWIGTVESNIGEEIDGVIDHDPELAELNLILANDLTNNPNGYTCF